MEKDGTSGQIENCGCFSDGKRDSVRNKNCEKQQGNDDSSSNEGGDGTYYSKVCRSYRQYSTFNRCQRYTHAWRISSLPDRQRSVLPKHLCAGTEEWAEREKLFQSAELHNQYFLDCVLQYHGQLTSQEQLRMGQEHRDREDNASSSSSEEMSSDDDISKVQSVLKSVARDWSKEMAEERRQSDSPLLDALERYLPIENRGSCANEAPPLPESMDFESNSTPWEISNNDKTLVQRSSFNKIIRISVPGSGVSRLALDIASRGYEVQGNEFSFHMLLASDFILNGCAVDRPFRIAPWLGSTKNLVSSLDPTLQYSIPDVDPASMLLPESRHTTAEEGTNNASAEIRPEFSMVAGDFQDLYMNESQQGKWNGIVSCFFLDTAPSIVEYLQVMWNMLSDGGYLFNFGPLLYHWSSPPSRPSDINYEMYKSRFSYMDSRYTESIDLSWDDVRHVICRIGFEIIEEKIGLPATYTAFDRSMMNSSFSCIYFVARKVSSQNDQML